ncbi:MAG TPA: hypothetical protein DCY94_00510, partial [Firmicutes bacterium]|nr:hypothetical protein [Bacillota bacterium]
IDIENFILVSHRPDREYGQKYKNSNFININEMRYIEFVCLNLNEMKKLAVKQLKNGIPVMIGLCIRKFADDYAGVLDTRLYDYDRFLGYKRLKKSYALKTGDTVLHHWMTITGVHIEDGKTIRWKVEDSYGRETKKEGYYVMNDNYFDQYVITIVIDKRYLSKRLLDLYNRKGISEE